MQSCFLFIFLILGVSYAFADCSINTAIGVIDVVEKLSADVDDASGPKALRELNCETIKKINAEQALDPITQKYSQSSIKSLMEDVGDNNFGKAKWSKCLKGKMASREEASFNDAYMMKCFSQNKDYDKKSTTKDECNSLLKGLSGDGVSTVSNSRDCNFQDKFKMSLPSESFFSDYNKLISAGYEADQAEDIKEAFKFWQDKLNKEQSLIESGQLDHTPMATRTLLDIQKMKTFINENNLPKEAFVNYLVSVMDIYKASKGDEAPICNTQKTPNNLVGNFEKDLNNRAIPVLDEKGELQLRTGAIKNPYSKRDDQSVIERIDQKITENYMKAKSANSNLMKHDKDFFKQLYNSAYDMEYIRMHGRHPDDVIRFNEPVIFSTAKAEIKSYDNKTICSEEVVTSSGNISGLFLDNETTILSSDNLEEDLTKFYKKHDQRRKLSGEKIRGDKAIDERVGVVSSQIKEGQKQLEGLLKSIGRAIDDGQEITQVNISAAASTYTNTNQVLNYFDSDELGEIPSFDKLNRERARSISQAIIKQYPQLSEEIFTVTTPEHAAWGNYISITETDQQNIQEHSLYNEVSQCQEYLTRYLNRSGQCHVSKKGGIRDVLMCYNGTKGSSLPIEVRESCIEYNTENEIAFDKSKLANDKYLSKKSYDKEKFVDVNFVSKKKPEILDSKVSGAKVKMAAANLTLKCKNISAANTKAQGFPKRRPAFKLPSINISLPKQSCTTSCPAFN